LQFATAKEASIGTNTSNPQQNTEQVTGRVTDSEGNPIAGATILVKGTTIGVVTDSDGKYRIEKRGNQDVLLFSFIGMEQQAIKIGSQTVVNVALKDGSNLLTEVVAIGYGNQQKKDITGAVSSIKSEDFNKGVASSPEQLIQGKISGVNITSSSGAPGSGQRIIIRGQGSIREGTGPLYVVDGFPLGLSGTGSDDYNPMNFINSEDIESIDVLKDASATAIYGTRAANGVILITTKKGKSGSTQLSVASRLGVSTMAKKIDVFSADEFRKQVKAIGGNLIDRGGNTDWQKELTRTAMTQDHSLTMQGGSKDFTYRASLGYLKQEGIIIDTQMERYSGNVKATQKLLSGKLNIDYGLNVSVEKNQNADAGTLVSSMLSFNPTYTARDANGDPVKYPDFTNPLIEAQLNKTFGEKRKTIASFSPSLEIVKGLVYKLNFGYENNSSNVDLQKMPSTNPSQEGYLQQEYINGYNTLIENYLTYNKKWKEHDFTALAGQSYQKTFYRYTSWSIQDFKPTGIEPRYNPGLGRHLAVAAENQPHGEAQINELQSFFGRLNYSYLGKYLLTATVRVDGSSKFGDNNKYGTFPSFAAGWRISEEKFMQNTGVDNLKLRLGWGKTGNQEIPPKITKASFIPSPAGTDTYPLDNSNSYYQGTIYVRVSNPNIQWEVSTQTNAGLDFAFLGGALSGTFDYYRKQSNNILLEVPTVDPIQPVKGSTYWTNVKDMTITNKGFELSLDYKYKKAKDFSFGLGGNISYVDNVVKNSPFTILTTGSASGSGQTGATINGLTNGAAVGSFYMQKFTGIGEDGLSVYENNKERMIVGRALPNVTYGFYVNMSYKRFDLSANFNGVSGNKIYNHTAMSAFYKAQLSNSSNTTAKAIEYSNESIANSASVSTRYLENGAYLRLNNLSLGYNFDTNALKIGQWIKGMRLYATGQNLFVITKYTGFDPEVNQNRSVGGFQSFGIDVDGYPKARTFSIGLNLTIN
jgi:iron complex outermembrane receptor protein